MGRPLKRRLIPRIPVVKPVLDLSRIDGAKLDDMLGNIIDQEELEKSNKIKFFKPYQKQIDFCNAGKEKREILLLAGNQVGKTEIGAYKVTCHLTGIYPDWWQGERWDRPTRGWIAGQTSLVVRDVQQKKLCGEPGVEAAFGTGMIPKELLIDKSLARGITDAYDTIQVRHVSGGISISKFKSYEQGRAKFQGETLDFGWCDEEPFEDVYSEFLTRLNEGGRIFTTFTPLQGRSKVVLRFLEEHSPDRIVVNMSLDDVTHFSAEEKKKRVSGYSSHERDARERGIPTLGSGAVYTFSENIIREDQIMHLPPHWVKLWGIDFGIGHPFAAVLAAWDKDTDIIHIIHAFKQPDLLPMMHAAAMKNIAAGVPVAWPHDGHQRQQGSDTAEELYAVYKRHGLVMLPDHAAFEGGGYSREAAVLEIQERSMTGRFKVASHLSDWLSEFRLYHRKDGLIVRQEDDIMSATEKIIMAKRFARAVPLGRKVPQRPSGLIADGVDSELWGA